MKKFIGLTGVSNDNVLITPSGKELFRVLRVVGMIVQRVQHWIAVRTWR